MVDVTSRYNSAETSGLDTARAKQPARSRVQFQKDCALLIASWINNPAPPPPPPPPPNTPPIPGLWTMIFSDEFTAPVNGTVDPKLWNVLDNTPYGDPPHGTLHRYMAKNVVVSDGTCKLIAKPEAIGGKTFSSGAISTRSENGKPQTFAMGLRTYQECRMRVSPGGGAWPAYWLRGAQGGSGWPAYGEVDIVELYGPALKVAESNFHKTGGNITAGHHALLTPYSEWHTYGLYLNADRLQWWYDGKMVREYKAVTSSDFSALQEMHTILLNLAIGGAGPTTWHGWDGKWKEGELPLTMELDYVRVWKQ